MRATRAAMHALSSLPSWFQSGNRGANFLIEIPATGCPHGQVHSGGESSGIVLARDTQRALWRQTAAGRNAFAAQLSHGSPDTSAVSSDQHELQLPGRRKPGTDPQGRRGVRAVP